MQNSLREAADEQHAADLSLSWNGDIEAAGGTAVGDALRINTALTKLELECTGIDAKGSSLVEQCIADTVSWGDV